MSEESASSMTNACCLNHFISCKSILVSLVQFELQNKMPVSHLKYDIYLFLCLESTRLWQDETDQEAQSGKIFVTEDIL